MLPRQLETTNRLLFPLPFENPSKVVLTKSNCEVVQRWGAELSWLTLPDNLPQPSAQPVAPTVAPTVARFAIGATGCADDRLVYTLHNSHKKQSRENVVSNSTEEKNSHDNDCSKSSVFSWRLNSSNDGCDVSVAGKLFHTRAPATAKARSPISGFVSELMQDRAIVTMEGRIGNRTQAFEWYHFEWSCVTSSPDFKVTILLFVINFYHWSIIVS